MTRRTLALGVVLGGTLDVLRRARQEMETRVGDK